MGLLPIRRVAVRSRIRFVPATLAIVGFLCGPTLARASANELEATALGGSIGSGNLLAVAGIGGRVLLDSTPVAEAKVFAYQLVEKSIHRVLTDGAGSFLFESLPAGIYKIIAHKAGFAPTVLLLQRQASDAAQFVTLELEKEPDAAKVDFWSVRSQIPGDVLRELEVPAFETQASAGTMATAQGGLSAEVSALTGITDIKPEASARLSGGNVGVAGQLGDVKVYLQGNFQKIESESGDPAFPGLAGVDGSSRNVSINLQTPNQGVFEIESSSNRLTTSEDGFVLPVQASQYQFGWNRNVGENGTTSIQAFYLEENGLYNKGWIEPLDLPFASRTLQLEGRYSHTLDTATVRGGLRFRERSGNYSQLYAGTSDALARNDLDAFGSADWKVSDAVVMEYGLFTTLRDGSVTLTPRGGVILHLGPNWQTSASVSHRVELDEVSDRGDFAPVFLDDMLTCGESESSCYEVGLQRGTSAADHLALGASFRDVDSTVRLFLSSNFFDHTEGLFLVPGDALPEVTASWRRRLSPAVVTNLSARFADGGGGVYQSVSRRRFENNVMLLSTSIDTTFESTATGVFVTFQRLAQQLDQVSKSPHQKALSPEAELERLELVVSQNLSNLLNLSSDWAVRVGMELARGASFFHSDVDPTELRRQIMTGVAVRF
ncbi:MAG: carboxypeptidase regulatory-like domain-containing protein [Thermoanaerobaculia bacterium]